MRNFISNNWLTLFIFIGLLCIACAKTLNPSRFSDFINIIGHSKYFKLYSKSKKLISVFNTLLFVNFCIALAIFIYIYYYPISDFNLIFFLKLLSGIFAFLTAQYWLEKTIGYLFEIPDLISFYVFQKKTYLNYVGLIILTSNIFLIYTSFSSKNIIIATIAIVFLIKSISFISIVINYQKTLIYNSFYFLLYLCTLEIGPYIILYKVVSDYKA